MKIIPVAFDSMGVRSAATYIETKDVKIFIDPSASLGPFRLGLPPHAREWQRLEESWTKIIELVKNCQVIVIGHYHYDHHSPNYMIETIYGNKTVLVKHPTQNINFSQKRRSYVFLNKIKSLVKKLEYADGKKFLFGETKIQFSEPVFHGINSKLGYVIETLIDDGSFRFIHTDDIEGPAIDNQAEFILKNKANLAFIYGPMTYIMSRYGEDNVKKSNDNLIKILEECPMQNMVVDHHLLRDINWKKQIAPVFDAAKRLGKKVLTAAEYAGKETDQLEADRRNLWKSEPKAKFEISEGLKHLVTKKQD